ncbi:unnamed protein product [Rotaria sp. Silwood1]|nr:unnamed protein product [Rotaria sp. Silwood1]CAF4804879.1 unnamed protein product [Rotaria sp. Silwood1]
MQLVEKELVDLDTDVNRYLSEPERRIFHPNYTSHSITLRRLLSHSASIYVNPQVRNTYYRPNDDVFNESLAEFCFKYVNPNTPYWLPKPPGTVTSYSNEGTALAALVVERITNMSYIDYVKQKVLAPLGIDVTKVGVRLADFVNTEDFVKHYVYALNSSHLIWWNRQIPQLHITQIPGNLPTWLHISHFGFSPYPSALLRMSARTLSVYLQMFLNNGSNILHSRSIAEMRIVVGGGLISPYNQGLASNSTGRRLPSEFGLAWYWYTMSNGRRYIGHTGAIPGVLHLMLVNEKNTLGVIVLSNGDATEPTDLSKEIIETVERIHMTLFECFDVNLGHASAFRTKKTLIKYFFAIFLIFDTFV